MNLQMVPNRDILEESKNSLNKKPIRSFGRIKSRKLSCHKKFLLENILPQYQINFLDNDENSTKSLILEQSKNYQKNILEIGFGFGDFLFANALNRPNSMFFGFEPHLNGIVNLLAKLEVKSLKNIKISTLDVRLTAKNFLDDFFDEIYILFPDPWPKAKHFKRRLISTDFLDNFIATKLKKEGKLIIATDHDSYKTWILAQIANSKKLSWQAKSKKDWQNFPSDWVKTKYQQKAELEGRVSVIFNLKKI